MHRKFKRPTPEEEAEINRGIADDPDTWVLSDAEWAKAVPLREVDPDLVTALRSISGERRSAKQFHVLPRARGWAVKKVGMRSTEIFETKSDAIRRARELAAASQVEWIEFGRDGTVRNIHRPMDGQSQLQS